MIKTTINPRLLITAALFAIFPAFLSAQDFMDLSDFLKITESSPKKYDFNLMKNRISGVSDPGRLNFNYYYLHDSAGVRTAQPFNISMEANELQELAWEALMMEEPDTALIIFKEVLSMSADYTPAMTGVGQSLEMLGDKLSAVEWYRKALTSNPIDYIAAWSMARGMFEIGKQDSAIIMMLYAWILNRNSLEIKKDLSRMLTKMGNEFKDWNFVPQFIIEETIEKITVSYYPAWMGYAVCQAVWEKEPGFSESRNIDGDISMFRERECLSCLVYTMDSDKKDVDKDPALIAFKAALTKKMAMEFILFEILLPEKPDMAYLLDQARMQRLIEYLNVTRL